MYEELPATPEVRPTLAMASNKVTETIAMDGVAVAFISGALVAGGAVAAISVWKNEKKNC